MRFFLLKLAIMASLIAINFPSFALDKKYLPRSTITQPQTDAQRLNAFKPPPPMPKQPSVFDRGQSAITHTFKNGNTIRPDAGLKSGTPTVGVRGTFRNP